MRIGIPKELKEDEYRVAMTPAGVRELCSGGPTVLVEQGAGVGSAISDEQYVATGAKVLGHADDVWAESDLVCEVKEPVPQEHHRLGLRSGQVRPVVWLRWSGRGSCNVPEGGRGVLISGVPGVRRVRVVVIGGGSTAAPGSWGPQRPAGPGRRGNCVYRAVS